MKFKKIWFCFLVLALVCLASAAMGADAPAQSERERLIEALRNQGESRELVQEEQGDERSQGESRRQGEERIVTETIDEDTFHLMAGNLPGHLPEYITGWRFRAGETPVLLPFEWEPRWANLNEDINPRTSETNQLAIYVKHVYHPFFNLFNDTMGSDITCDILDEDKRLIIRDIELGGAPRSFVFGNPQYRLINERVATQNSRTIYFRVNVDFDAIASAYNPYVPNSYVTDMDELMRRFRRLGLALGVEHATSVAHDNVAWEAKYGKYIEFATQRHAEFGEPYIAWYEDEDGNYIERDLIWNEAERRWVEE